MDRIDRLVERWWEGASYFILCAGAYAVAFIIVMVPIYTIDALGLYEATSWAYWLSAGLLAPYLLASSTGRSMLKAITSRRSKARRAHLTE